MPNLEELERDVADYRARFPKLSPEELADRYGDRICWKCASFGAASALPSVIPGVGTAVQVVTEVGAISTDLMLMLRWMGSMTAGIGLLCGRDMTTRFNQDFIGVLGLWCGVAQTARTATTRIATRAAAAQFNRRVPGKTLALLNRRIATTILTKYGTKRGGIALGKLIPLGVGALVGGGFNLAVMKGFKAQAIEFYSDEPTVYWAEEVECA